MKKYLIIILSMALLFTAPAFADFEIEDYVGVYDCEHVCYCDDCGNFYDCDYQIPMLLIDTEDAQAVNAEILEKTAEKLEYVRESAEQGNSISCLGIAFDSWIHDGYLTLVLQIENDWDYGEFYVCTFDLDSGKRLENTDYAEYLGLSERELNEAVRKSLHVAFDEIYGDYPADDIYFAEILEWTCSDENVADCKLCIAEDGSVNIHCSIGSIAGAASYEHLVPLA